MRQSEDGWMDLREGPVTEERKKGDRPVSCERCGAPFTCTLGGPCWCSGEDFRLPLTTEGGPSDCLCPACLKLYALELKAKGLGPKTP